MTSIDPIPPVTFRTRRRRLWLGTSLAMAPVWLLVVLATAVMTVRSFGRADVVEIALKVLLGPAAGGIGAVLGARGRLSWVRASAAGLEFAGTRRKPVFLPWSAVRSVRLRFAGPMTELVVTPTSIDAVTVAPMPGLAPRRRRRGDVPEFLVDVGMMTPGPAALLDELNRRLAAHR